MREFLLNSEELLDKDALAYIAREEIPGILPCSWTKWNERVQLVYFLDGLTPLSKKREELSLEELCEVCKWVLDLLMKIESGMMLSPENVSWDMDSIYLDEENQVNIICLPAVLPIEVLESRIYIKRVYALMEEILTPKEGGDVICRHIETLKNRSFGDWVALKNTLVARTPIDEEVLTLRSVNTSTPFVFKIGHDDFVIGPDPDACQGCIYGALSVSPVHAMIGWNDISYYVMDLDSREGTFLNDIKLQPQTQIPIGKGSVLRFAECTFSVE